ncbi:hypothetical protein VN97_g3300 [Penicillium thymicola]|uniref:Uncharacterized protein n=1 Tax=Penicillium thymicola TaxID=293382 RepID=A0AAI9TNJ0_PENTH|nr:hypothetical protein VN97_g3300 [Penicillium thymicola]
MLCVVKGEERDQKNIGVEGQRDDVLLHYLLALGICVRIGVTGGLRPRLGFFYLKCRAAKKYMYRLVNYRGALKWNSAVIFALNTVALIPLGIWISRSVDALTVGGSRAIIEVLKSTLGNSVELMVISSSLHLQCKYRLTMIYPDRNQCDRAKPTAHLPVRDTWKCYKQFITGKSQYQIQPLLL